MHISETIYLSTYLSLNLPAWSLLAAEDVPVLPRTVVSMTVAFSYLLT